MDIRKRLVDYFESVGEVLRGDAKKASIFPNPADVGNTREEIFSAFLRNHIPAWCNVERGGFLFNWQGEESGQLDIVISSGVAPKFVPFPENGKTVRETEGVLGVFSIKSELRARDVDSALRDFSRIPQMRTTQSNVSPSLRNANMAEFIYLHLYANDANDIGAIFQKFMISTRSTPKFQ